MIARGALAVLTVGAVVAWAAFPTQPNYDSLWSLVWARDLLDGVAPGFDVYRAPTQHPLLLPVGLALAPLGDAGARIFVLFCVLSLVALIAAVHRLGVLAAGALCGVVAALMLASRLNFALLASIGFLDIPYCALVAWAMVLEAERPRRGRPVWVLLTLAGLLRPEAWILAGAYGVWLARANQGSDPWLAFARAVAPAAIAPVVWAALDLAVTGDPLFSLHHTDTLAAELQRDRPLLELPLVMVDLLAEIVKAPVLAGAAVGAALAAALRRRALLVPGAVALLTAGTYLFIASGGLATVYRYLLVAGVALIVFAAFAVTGWATLPRESSWRTRWAQAALALALGGGLYTATHLSPAKVAADLRERARIKDNLRALLTDPAVVAARRCGPVSVPNHKLVPDVRWFLGVGAGAVLSRSDRSRPVARRGVAIVIDRRIENRPALNVREQQADGVEITIAPAGFAPVAHNRDFAAWGRC